MYASVFISLEMSVETSLSKASNASFNVSVFLAVVSLSIFLYRTINAWQLSFRHFLVRHFRNVHLFFFYVWKIDGVILKLYFFMRIKKVPFISKKYNFFDRHRSKNTLTIERCIEILSASQLQQYHLYRFFGSKSRWKVFIWQVANYVVIFWTRKR